MPSVRIRQHNSYATLHVDSDTEHLSGSIARPPKTRPSLSVLRSGNEPPKHRPRPSTGLSRVQSRIFRDSIRNSRASTYHGLLSAQGSETNSLQSSHRLPKRAQTRELVSQHPGWTGDSAAAHRESYEESWAKYQHHHDDIIEHLDVVGACFIEPMPSHPVLNNKQIRKSVLCQP
jgi:hypothetical protein